MKLAYRTLETQLGFCGFIASERGVRHVILPNRPLARVKREVASRAAQAVEDPGLLPDFTDDLDRYCAGEPVEFDVEYDWAGATAHDIAVWRACARVGYGRTSTYGELAEAIGSPRGARAVGMAMKRNRCPIAIPCHRILASGGKLGGYSGTGGLDFKQRLLALERAAQAPSR